MIENAVITRTFLGRRCGCLTAFITIHGREIDTNYGGYNLSHIGNYPFPTYGACAIAEILRVLDVESWESLPGTNIRIRINSDGKLTHIGHIYLDRWFSYETFYSENSSNAGKADYE